mmetsp:Transcript_8977/g.12289  ORF Transcript_8977/g.12289 Transcript_8977/m.12289 type:complete len:88 (+) Transcript_8977:135-398(+)
MELRVASPVFDVLTLFDPTSKFEFNFVRETLERDFGYKDAGLAEGMIFILDNIFHNSLRSVPIHVLTNTGKDFIWLRNCRCAKLLYN